MSDVRQELLAMIRAHQQRYGAGNAEVLCAAIHDHMAAHFHHHAAAQAAEAPADPAPAEPDAEPVVESGAAPI